MSNEQPTPPLWEVMHQVSMETADMDLPLEHCIAAELRAVADAIDTTGGKPPERRRGGVTTAHVIYRFSHPHGASWCIEQWPAGVTDSMVVSFRRWNQTRSLLNRAARWTGAGWDSTRWVPKPPAVPFTILGKVEDYMRGLDP